MKLIDLFFFFIICIAIWCAQLPSPTSNAPDITWKYVMTDVEGKEHIVKIVAKKKPWVWESVAGDGTMCISIGDESYARIVKFVKSSEPVTAK